MAASAVDTVVAVCADGALREALQGAARAAWPGARVVGVGPAGEAAGPTGPCGATVVLLDLAPGTPAWRGLGPGRPRAPVVGVSAGAPPEAMLDAEALGVAAFLHAPVEPATLAALWARLEARLPAGGP